MSTDTTHPHPYSPSSGGLSDEWRPTSHHSDDNPPLDGPTRTHHRRDRSLFGGLLVGTALLYLVNLSVSGWANQFYAAAAQAGSKSWKAFLFGSLDQSNFITVDKPPASLWVMDLSVKFFGANSWSVLVPQALEGVAAVALLYAAVRRVSGPTAGLLAGAALATTPVAALMFRFDNPDALLVLLMTAAGYATVRAIEAAKHALDRAGRRAHRVRLPDQDAAAARPSGRSPGRAPAQPIRPGAGSRHSDRRGGSRGRR